MKHPNCFCVVRTSTPELNTTPTMADGDALSETWQPDLWYFQGDLPIPRSCVCGGNQHIALVDAASDSAA